jgi:hypothetical protein
MRQVRSKSFEAQRKTVELALVRARKAKAEMEELTRRNWTGGEMPFVAPVKEVANDLMVAVDALQQAERRLASLASSAAAKGK